MKPTFVDSLFFILGALACVLVIAWLVTTCSNHEAAKAKCESQGMTLIVDRYGDMVCIQGVRP